MKLIRNYLYNAGYQIFVLIIPFITIPYISRVFGVKGVGINAYTNSIIQYFILFGSIGISLYGNRTIAFTRDNKRELSKNFWEITFLRFVTLSIAYLFFLFFLIVVNEYQLLYIYQSILIIATAFDISWFFMGIEDFKKIILRNIIIKLISLIAIFLFVKTKNDVGIYILILSLSTLFGNLSLWFYLMNIVNKPIIKDIKIFKHLPHVVQLFIPQAATQVYLVLNKTMLGMILGVESAGYYENADKIVKIVLSIVTAVGTVMLPRVANTFSKGDLEKVKKYLYQSFSFVSFISTPLSLGLIAIAPTFSIWFLGEDFAVTGELIRILAFVIILIGWSNVLGTQYLLPTNQTKYYTISVSLGALTNIILNVSLITTIGIKGAVLATVSAETVVVVTQFYFTRKQLSIKLLFGDSWKYGVASIIMYTVIRPITHYVHNKPLQLSIQVFIGVFIYLLCCVILRVSLLEKVKEMLKKVN